MSAPEQLRILAASPLVPRIRQRLSRRAILQGLLAAGAASLLSACAAPRAERSVGADGAELEQELSIYTWGDYLDPELLRELEQQLAAAVTVDVFNSNEELVAKLVAARGTSGYDIVVPSGPFIPPLAANGLIEPLDHALLPNLVNLDDAVRSPEWDPGNTYSVCMAWGTTGFVYDTTVIERELRSWGDFLDCAQHEASGRTSLIDEPIALTGLYFWANGIDWATTDPAHYDRAERFLVDELAQHVSAFDSYPGGAAIPQATSALFQAWNGDARLGILESGDPERWRWVLGAPATEFWMDNWAIAAGARHPKAAHAFINAMLDPELALRQTDYIGNDVGVAGLREAAEEEGLELLDLLYFDEPQLATMQPTVFNELQDRAVQIWNRMKAQASR